jgi:energy-coupling factor transporter ATP-binding protein EcfA2
MPAATGTDDLGDLLGRVRDHVAILPVRDAPGAADLRGAQAAVLDLLDGYLVDRLNEQDRPLLVVIGGPTGAGKSTLLNSLVGRVVTTAGVLRPTTRTPVLLHHPDNTAAARRLLPGLAGGADLRLVPSRDVPAGMFVLDSPDLDSWLDTNREVAVRMIEIADVWLFVSTGTDYADGLPWDLLRSAVRRQAAVATVLNRLRPSELDAVPKHFARMLVDHGLGGAPLIQIPDVPLIDDRIPYRFVQPLHDWLGSQAGWSVRDQYLERATGITVDRVVAALDRLLTVATARAAAGGRLREDLRALFSLARRRVRERLDAARPTTELVEQWEAIVRSAVTRRSRWRAGGGTTLGGAETAVAAAVQDVVRGALVDPLTSALAAFAERAGGDGALPADVDDRVAGLVAGWLDGIQAGVGGSRDEQPARWQVATLAVATAALVEGVAPADLLPPGVPVDRARADLAARLDELLDAEEERMSERLGSPGTAPELSRLRVDLAELEQHQAS